MQAVATDLDERVFLDGESFIAHVRKQKEKLIKTNRELEAVISMFELWQGEVGHERLKAAVANGMLATEPRWEIKFLKGF